MNCEICGKPSSIHVTDVHVGSPVKREHHYCREHAPADLKARLVTTPADEVKMVQQMIEQLDAREMDPEEKKRFRQELEQLAKDIAEGRSRLGDPG